MKAFSFLAAAAAGALTAYLFDPEQGPRRRAMARDKLREKLSELRKARASLQPAPEEQAGRTPESSDLTRLPH